MEFNGSFEELVALINAAGISGHWNNEGAFHEFLGDAGAILNWWPANSRITIGGNPESRLPLEALFEGSGET